MSSIKDYVLSEYWIMAGSLITATSLLLFSSESEIKAIGSVIVFYLSPGYLVVGLRKERINFASVLLISATLSFVGCTYAIYFLSVFRIIPDETIILLGSLLILLGYVFLGFLHHRSDRIDNSRLDLNELGLLFILLIIGLTIRFPFLNYSDFQTDEARMLLRSKEFMQGNREVLLLHKKGPTEILVPLIPMILSMPDEFSARLPFLLAGVLAVIGTMAIGEELLANRRLGVLAALLFALNGYFIAFSRFAQYHTILLITFQALALSIHRILKGEEKNSQIFWGMIAAACAGFGLLTHYDFVFFAFLSFVVLALFIRNAAKEGIGIPYFLFTMIVLLGIIAPMTFYVPFILHSNFINTLDYYLWDRVGGTTTASTRFDYTWHISSMIFYLSIYYFIAVVGLALFGACIIRKDWRQIGSGTVSGGNGYVLLWFSSYFIIYGFLMGRPITHGYTIFIPGVLLAAKGIRQISTFWQHKKLLKASWGICLALILTLSLYYSMLLFWSHDPEYVTSFPESQHPLFPIIEGGGTRGGHFGVPESRAWKVPGVLFREGILSGPYRSNENVEVTEWYLDHPQAGGSILYFIYSIGIGDHEFSLEELEATWTPIGQVFKKRQKTIIIFANGSTGSNLGDLHWKDYEQRFDELLMTEFN